MRIDAYNSVSQVYASQPQVKAAKANAYVQQDEKYEVSDSARSYSVARAAVANTTDVREDKVADIKARMAAGTYNISSEAIADKILSNAETIAF